MTERPGRDVDAPLFELRIRAVMAQLGMMRADLLLMRIEVARTQHRVSQLRERLGVSDG